MNHITGARRYAGRTSLPSGPPPRGPSSSIKPGERGQAVSGVRSAFPFSCSNTPVGFLRVRANSAEVALDSCSLPSSEAKVRKALKLHVLMINAAAFSVVWLSLLLCVQLERRRPPLSDAEQTAAQAFLCVPAGRARVKEADSSRMFS